MSHRSTFSAAPRLPRLLGTWLLAAALALPGCGGGDTPPDSGPPPVEVAPVGPPVTQTVGAAGGTVLATASGVKVSLSIPDGALAADTTVSITPLAPAAGDVVSVKLAPGGIYFAKPVTVVLEYPAGNVPAAKASLRQRLGTADSYLVTTVDTTARTLSARLTTFGGAALDALALPAAAGASASTGRARALHVQALADPVPPGDATLSASSSTTAAEMVASARRQVTIMEIEGDFVSAYALQASMASLIMRRGDVDFPVDAMTFLGEAHDTACRAVSDAINNARTAPITRLADFKPLRQKLGGWWRITEMTDIDRAGCPALTPAVTIGTFMDAALALTEREIDFQKLRLPAVRTPNEIKEPSEAVKEARRAKRDLEALQAAADLLELPPVLQQGPGRAQATQAGALAAGGAATYAGILQTNLLDPLVIPAREAAWTVAKGSQSLAQYPTVIDAFGGVPVLAQDVQFVRTRVEVRINSAGGDEASRSVLGFDTVPDQPADPKRSDTLTVNKSGTVAISGNIANLECASAGDETLKVTFDDAEVATVSAGGGNLLAGALNSFTPARLLQAAGLPPEDTGNHTLRVRRSGSPCAAALGITDDLLATVTLSFASERKIFYSRRPVDGWGLGIESINADGTGRVVHTTNGLVEICQPDGVEDACYFTNDKDDNHPTLSPDGKQLLFTRWARSSPQLGGIWLMDVSSGSASLLVAGGGSPSWSPDGRRLAYTTGTTGGYPVQPQTLWVMNIDGTGAVQVASLYGIEGTAWSPDGTKIALSSSSPSGLYVVPVDGSATPSQLVANPYASVTPSAWSPDGRRIAFLSYMVGSAGSMVRGIQVVNADGTGLTPLVENIYQAPAWSPDGSEIAYLGNGNAGIMAVKVNGGNVRSITSGLTDFDSYSGPSWR